MPKKPISDNVTDITTGKKPTQTSTKKKSPQATKPSTAAKTKKASTTKATTSNDKPAKTQSKAKSKTTSVKAALIPTETRLQMIEETAYYLAEQRGFSDGDPVQDWIQAESRVNEMLG